MIRSNENQTNRVGSRIPTLLMTYHLLITYSLSESEVESKRKNKLITMLDSGPYDRLALPLLLLSPTI